MKKDGELRPISRYIHCFTDDGDKLLRAHAASSVSGDHKGGL